MAANLKKAFSEQTELLKGKYHSLQVLLDSPSCHIPIEQFEEDEVETIFFYNYPNEQGKVVAYNILARCNLALLFCMDKGVQQLLNDYLPNAHIYAIDTPVLEHFAEKSKNREAEKLFAFFHSNRMLVSVMNQGKVSFVNHFSATNLGDFVYFILQVWNVSGLNQREDEIHLVGRIPEREKLINELHKYIHKVYVINPSAEFNRSEVATNPQSTYDLQTLLCAGL